MNVCFVHQNKYMPNQRPFFGVFHSKMFLLEFDDRVRLVVTSANLYKVDWELMSNVVWFQDFFAKDVLGDDIVTTEFEMYLSTFLSDLCPQQKKGKENTAVKPQPVYKAEIDLSKYYFGPTVVKLVASVHG